MADDRAAGDRTALPGEDGSVWLATSERTDYAALDGGLTVDVAVIGGGIAGVTAAFELVEAGQSVAVLERDRIVEGVTGHTTAKLTSLHGTVYDHLLSEFGEREARQYAAANEAAIDAVESTIDERGIDCGFERTSAYTYVESADATGKLRDEARAARRLDLPATYTDSTPLPFEVAGAVCLDDQAQFHPRKYLLALASAVDGEGGHVFERTRATAVDAGTPCRVDTDRGSVRAADVVVATHFPIYDHAFFYGRMSPKRSYVLAVELDSEPPEGLYYRAEEPYFSVRPLPGSDSPRVLVGGENHRTGRGGSTAERYRRLARRARSRFDVASVEHRWSTQDFASVDGVPFVGEHSPGTDHVYLATGFGGWGMTNGTAAGRILADRILGRESPWAEVFRPTRLNVGASARSLIEHNADAAGQFLVDRLDPSAAVDLDEVDPGEAAVVNVRGESVGVSRDADGAYHAVSAVCPHMGCHVEWNDAERSWDCPCHGSRFDPEGRVLDTPAVEDLERYDLPELTLTDAGRE